MSDAVLARNLVFRAAGGQPGEKIKVLQERAYQALCKINPEQWTRRRVRALINLEAARIEHREMREIAAVIEARERRQDARREHQKHLDRITRLEALLTATDPAFHRHQIGALRGQAGRVDRSRD